eukprot:6454760-Amphidinium_carterae.1
MLVVREGNGQFSYQDKEQDALREQVRKSNTLVNDMSETLRQPLRDTEEAAALRARESAERDREVRPSTSVDSTINDWI